MSTITENNKNPADDTIQKTYFSNWGLIPKIREDENLKLSQVLHHFFVEFNPFYLISALCVFYGVFLVANNIQALGDVTYLSGEIILFLVLQAYEALIIIGMAFLVFKVHRIRPAIILCLLESVLLFDCTFRLESLSLLGYTAIIMFAVWFVLVFIKVKVIAIIMQLELTWQHYSVIGATALSIATIILLLSQTWINHLLLLQISAWVGALVLLILVFKRPTLISHLANSTTAKAISEKCIHAAFTLLAAFYFYHLFAFLFFAAESGVRGPAIIPQFAAMSLLLTIIKTKESDIIKWGIITLLLTLTAPIGTSYAFFILAGVFLYHVPGKLNYNYTIVVAFLCYSGYWLIGWQGLGSALPPLPEIFSPPTLLLGLSLLVIGVLFKNIIAFSIITIVISYRIFYSMESILPSSELGQGTFILASGFIIFILGLMINWWLKSDEITQSDVIADESL